MNNKSSQLISRKEDIKNHGSNEHLLYLFLSVCFCFPLFGILVFSVGEKSRQNVDFSESLAFSIGLFLPLFLRLFGGEKRRSWPSLRAFSILSDLHLITSVCKQMRNVLS